MNIVNKKLLSVSGISINNNDVSHYNFDNETGELHINNLDVSHSGKYQCNLSLLSEDPAFLRTYILDVRGNC